MDVAAFFRELRQIARQHTDRTGDQVFVWSGATLVAPVPSGNEHIHAVLHTHTCIHAKKTDRIDEHVFVWSGVTFAAPVPSDP